MEVLAEKKRDIQTEAKNDLNWGTGCCGPAGGWLRPIPQWVSCAVCVRTTSAVPMSSSAPLGLLLYKWFDDLVL